jgi:hypothetical protein
VFRQVGRDLMGQVVGIYGNAGAAGPYQVGDHSPQHRYAGDREKGFMACPGVGCQSGSKPRRQYQCFHGLNRFK